MIRPSQDLGKLANEYEARLPVFFRFLTRGFGTKETPHNDALSFIFFQHDYLSRIMEIGRADAEANDEALTAFLEADRS